MYIAYAAIYRYINSEKFEPRLLYVTFSGLSGISDDMSSRASTEVRYL